MADEKVFVPETIEAQPFPNEGQDQFPAGSDVSGNVHSPTTIKENPIPRKRTAVELIGSVLNTVSRKILQPFQFAKSGAIQVGEYENGVSGDIRISPTGITARDISGNTTFALDGETGNAVFSGEVRSGSVVTGKVVVGNGNVVIDGAGGGSITVQDENNQTVLDSLGIRSTTQFSSINNVFDSSNQVFSSSSFVDATDSSASLSLPRSSLVLFLIKTDAYLVESVGNTGDGRFQLNIDGGSVLETEIRLNAGSNQLSTRSSHWVVTLSGGDHTIKLQGKVTPSAGSPTMTLHTFFWSYIVLGT